MRTLYPLFSTSFLLFACVIQAQGGAWKSDKVETGSAQVKEEVLTETRLVQLRQIRDHQLRGGALDSALRTGLKITGISGSSGDRLAMAADWQALARISQRAGDLNGAVSSVKRAVLILKTTGNTAQVSAVTLELLDYLLQGKRYEEFKHLGEEALQVCRQNGDHAGAARVLYRQGECLNQQERAEDALPLLHLALRESPPNLDSPEAAGIQFALANANAGVGQWGPARTAFSEGISLDPNAPRSFPDLYGLEARIAEGAGDMRRALRCERLQATAKDSLLSAAMAERLAGIQLMYGVRAKEQDLEDLRLDNRTMKADLSGKVGQLHGFMVLSASLLAGLLVLFLLRARQVHSVRRTRMRNTVITGQAKEIQAKSLELERQNLRLSQALMEDEMRNRAQGPGEMQWVDLLLRTQIAHVPDPGTAGALSDFHDRIRVLTLLNRNMDKGAVQGKLNLKAHFTAMSADLLEKNGMAERIHPVFEVSEEDIHPEDLLPLSLLINELLLMSINRASETTGTSQVHVTLSRLGLQQGELLYADGTGGINREQLNNGSMGADLVQALTQSLGGSILLLKGECTTLQLTFEQGRQAELRKAS